MRTMTALSLGAVLALAPPPRPRRSPQGPRRRQSDTVLVRIGKEVITPPWSSAGSRRSPRRCAATSPRPMEQRLLERIVEERVWLLDAQRKGVSERPDIKRQLEQQRRDLLSAP